MANALNAITDIAERHCAPSFHLSSFVSRQLAKREMALCFPAVALEKPVSSLVTDNLSGQEFSVTLQLEMAPVAAITAA